jgi:hypothetical protein
MQSKKGGGVAATTPLKTSPWEEVSHFYLRPSKTSCSKRDQSPIFIEINRTTAGFES